MRALEGGENEEGEETGKKTVPSGIKREMGRAELDGKRAGEGDSRLLKLSLQHT